MTPESLLNVQPGVKGFVSLPVADRFWSKVDRSGECWLWVGFRSTRGYGQFWLDGKSRPAHVVAWELEHGRVIPEGMLGCHHCDNPPCVRPSHIFIGTMSDNIHDAYSKGRKVPTTTSVCKRGHGKDPGVECQECRRNWERARPPRPEHDRLRSVRRAQQRARQVGAAR